MRYVAVVALLVVVVFAAGYATRALTHQHHDGCRSGEPRVFCTSAVR